jgi:MOSC domain-containing protein YiiM
VETVEAIPGSGLEGDRYAVGRGTFTGTGRGYELTLVEAEALEDVDLSWEQARRNIVTRGVELNALVGRRFTVGSVECVGRRLAEPCSHLEKLVRPGIMRPLVHRAGLRADILAGGPIAVGDAVTAAD